ncbi:uncharacterized protein LOC126909100 [Daktulosphaira vitifoliae]|uniref:uncharacterized protein LOC126909100 n=1 Tax=Daktulosphaira vitifoliae TaxID=58002 RepID=UPI0021AAEE58|nr:uncharacterized protein LOC126909100 [Daktulosphaira vitifoliae]
MSMSENVSVVERMQVGPSAISPKRRKQCNTDNTIKSKRVKVKRLLDITTSGFHKTGESLNSQILWFYKKNIENVVRYQAFLSATRGDLVEKLRDCLKEMGPIKFNLKLEATYTVLNNENKYENRSFKTSAVELINEDDIDHAVDISYTKLLEEQENYAGKVEALEEHKKICGENKPFLPIMPEEGTKLKFESWGKTQELPFASL